RGWAAHPSSDRFAATFSPHEGRREEERGGCDCSSIYDPSSRVFRAPGETELFSVSRGAPRRAFRGGKRRGNKSPPGRCALAGRAEKPYFPVCLVSRVTSRPATEFKDNSIEPLMPGETSPWHG